MKQGILITAYKNFDHLHDLVSFFDSNFEIFIHIDKKSKINKNVLSALESIPQVKLISRKYSVNWGGLNHLKCILLLCNEAIKFKDITRFHLISGHDYPIKSCSELISFFHGNDNNNYISTFNMPLQQWTHGGMDRIEYYNLYDLINAKKHRNFIFKIVKLQSRLGFKRRYSKRLPKLFGGETWWSLNRDAVDYVVNYTKKNKKFLNRLRFTFCSEEMYFQTVLMNSSLATTIVNNSLRFIDWTSRNGNLPANLDMTDLKAIENSDCVFARKFDYPVSEELKSVIKNKLKN